MESLFDDIDRPPRINLLRSFVDFCRIFQGWPHLVKGFRRFGDTLEWSLGSMGETLFFHPDDVGAVFSSAGANGALGRTLLGGFQEQAEIVGNNGLVMNEGHSWRRQRRILQPGMHGQRISGYAEIMVDFVE